MLSNINFLFLTLTISFVTIINSEIHGENDYGGSARRVNVADSDVLMMYQKWVDAGLSSLIAAVADKKLKKHRTIVANKFGKCSNKADSIPKQARCVTDLLQNKIIGADDSRLKKPRRRLLKYGRKWDDDKWTGSFRMLRKKREIPVSRSNYNLHSTKEQLSPIGGVAKLVLESVLAKRNKTSAPNWQRTIERLKGVSDQKKKLRKRLEENSQESMDQQALRGLQHLMPKDGVNAEELSDPQNLKEFIKSRQNKKHKKPEEKLMDLVRDGMKLGYSLAGQNTSEFENKTMKLVSPRFFGLVPENKEQDEISLLSPSLFSLHSDGKGIENITSLFSLLQGLPMRDQHIWLDMIMEASGVNDASDKLEKELFEEEKKQKMKDNPNALKLFDPSKLVDDYGTPLYFEKKNATQIGGKMEENKIEIFETLHQSYSQEQLHAMNTTGYAFLSKEQLQFLYGTHSPYNNSKELDKFLQIKPEKMNDYVERDIKTFSELEKFNIRQKDIVLSPISFTFLTLVPVLASQPLILSPVIFSPLILSPSVFGAVILSPWMFVPLVLSPRVLGSLILSPFIFAPLILTPLVLHPAILSPGVFNPLILSPAVLTPIILSPQVFTPLILNPLVLSPIILSPLAGSPLILSPFVLSPIIASPQFLGGLILSPYALSPVILSPLIAFAAVLSPSWLS